MKIDPIRKTYQSRTVLDTCSMEIEQGRIYAVAGANGSGKSTLLRCLAGIEKPDVPFSVTGAEQLSMGYLPQSSYPFKMSLLKNVLVGLPRSGENVSRAKDLIEAFDLGELSSSRADRLSGGEKQKTALMRILMRRFGLLLLDEPTSAMDPRGVLTAEELITSHAKETGCTVMMVTHFMKQAERIADEIIFLSSGRTDGPVELSRFLSGQAGDAAREYLEFWGA
ncbi:MAG: ABC transporter ATP-binding protein [Eubacteriaceae bacterium]|nr:ABC transporter ATP-binding protein [Eubacteriaceae bacterium]